MRQPEILRTLGKELFYIGPVVAVLLIVGLFVSSSGDGSMKSARQSAVMQNAHVIGLAFYSHAQDHQGHYPEGDTSTEVFQQLMDGRYVTDPSIFYFAMPGKIPPDGKQIKPENVSYDATCCLDSSAPGGLPVVFLTGYKITYQPGAAAAPLTPFRGRTWSQWFFNVRSWRPFIAVYYMNNSSQALTAIDDGSIPHFIPADFDAKGKTYRQLTP